MAAHQVNFGPFRFDEANECLWQGSQLIQLRPKAFAVLKYLIAREGVLVTKQQLLADVWPEVYVNEAVLKDCIRQLRQALNDDAKSPQFIETAHRRGYRFIASLVKDIPGIQYAPPPTLPRTSENILGRDAAFAQLQRRLDDALAGNSQTVFVTGEAGIGKTTLVESFLDHASANICILRGQCLEQYGSGEAYLPILDALSHVEDPQIVATLRDCAQSWLLQIPRLSNFAGDEAKQDNPPGVTRERMLRELAEALELITVTMPVVLFLEDLHWS